MSTDDFFRGNQILLPRQKKGQANIDTVKKEDFLHLKTRRSQEILPPSPFSLISSSTHSCFTCLSHTPFSVTATQVIFHRQAEILETVSRRKNNNLEML